MRRCLPSIVLLLAVTGLFFLANCAAEGTLSAPTLKAISPVSVPVGHAALTLRVWGTNFTSASRVDFGGTSLEPTHWTPLTLTVTVPSTAFQTAKVISVSVTGDTARSLTFTVLNPLPTLSSLSTTSTLVGSTNCVLDITGKNFVSDTTVNFGGVTLAPAALASTKLTVKVPASAITEAQQLMVKAVNRGPGGGSSNGLDFTVMNPVPVLTSLSVTTITTGGADFTLNINGGNFLSDTTVDFGGVQLTPTTATPTTLSVGIPASAITRGRQLSVNVTNRGPGGGSSNGLVFTISNPIPEINSLSPAMVITGTQGFVLDITGKGFVSDTTVSLGALVLTPFTNTPTSVSVNVPASAVSKPGALFLAASNPSPGGGVSSPLEFTVANPTTALFRWQSVVNDAVTFPGDSRKFNSYNQPSMNVNRLVVFRARSKGGPTGEPAHGIFTRDMSFPESPLIVIFDRNTTVPQPNNLGTTFTEPPSFPRIGMISDTIASRGNHQPSWRYIPAGGTEATAGTTGVYTNPFGLLITGASKLGVVPDFSFFSVPGTSGIKFDVFPGAPAVTDGATIVFKGNYTVPDPNNPNGTISKTGVYYRDLTNRAIPLLDGTTPLAPAGGTNPVVLLADSNMLIPGTTTKFGSVAPPSAAGRRAVFAGFDNEDSPTKGGIYMTPLELNPPLTTLVAIGGPVPGEADGTVFNKLSETLSFDGRYVAFWGAWRTETKTLILQCPTKGNKIRNAYCRERYPDGYETTIPAHQGIFVVDTETRQATAVAKTPTDFADFIFWKFTGYVEGMGMGESEDTSEPARWHSEPYVAVSGLAGSSSDHPTFFTAFMARTGQMGNGAYVNPIDGIYLRRGLPGSPIAPVVMTGMDGSRIDPAAVDDLTHAVLPLTSIGMERDGFRGRWLVINVLWGTEDAGWAGIYLTDVPDELTW